MATTNLNLNTLAGTEKLKSFPTPYNDNMTAIDDAFGSGFGVGNNSSVDDELNGLGKGMAIIANGNTHAAITSGQYVYVRQHGSLSEGLYQATANISANGTLSGSNLTAVSSGGLNDVYSALNSNLGSHVIRSFTKTGIAIADGTPSSPTITTIDCSDQVPSGKAIYNAIVSVQYGNNWYTLPNFTDNAGQYLLLERVGTTSIRLKNTSTDWGATNVAITLFMK